MVVALPDPPSPRPLSDDPLVPSGKLHVFFFFKNTFYQVLSCKSSALYDKGKSIDLHWQLHIQKLLL